MKNQSRYIEAVEEALEDGCTDAAEGGVSPTEIAIRVDGDLDSVRRHLRRLVKDGQLEQVQGANPDTLRPRTSYLPKNDD